ncbi:myb-like domain, Myb/SANT-like DNA-binding domain protein [Artemisia annua]|uniref:Myb-like domain, Myb/SANT-like DNA-binding domain protein n=1 Tax=Artemisia annua TaxID=35608 RepID=A0A2U1QKH0_ARTAN|nr:myb-like domain, Myb/SANT-like DNA-binding domain protein [Artemisia annua]
MEPNKNRDHRKTNQVSRGAIHPRVQSQPYYRPQFYESSSQSQPGYRPQFYEPQSPPFFYTQQPFTQLPTQFDPFEPRYTQQKRRERVVVTRPKKKVNKNWTPEEEEALAKPWIKISVDKQRQTKQGFWGRVLKHYQSLMPRSQRTKDQLNSKWTPMNASIVAFNGYFQQAV